MFRTHVTQRGNARQFVLAAEGERLVYLELLRQSIPLHEVSLLGYWPMSNHVQAVVGSVGWTIVRKRRSLLKSNLNLISGFP